MVVVVVVVCNEFMISRIPLSLVVSTYIQRRFENRSHVSFVVECT